MPMVSIGDLARGLMLQRHLTTTKTDLARLSEMLASGRHADQAAEARGNLGPLAAIEGALTRLDAWQAAAGGLSGRLAAQQTALGALHGIADAQGTALMRLGLGTDDAPVALAAADARAHLDAATGLLNARFGAESVFAGTRSDGAAVRGGEALLDALWPVVAGAADAAEARSLVLDWFDDPSGFSAQGYTGGDPKASLPVGPGASAAQSVTADDPAIRRTLAGLAMAALVDRGLFAADPASRRDLTVQAGEVLVQGADERVHLAGEVGLAEQRIADIVTRNAAERTALGIARSTLISADPYATASELEAARLQLETLYAVTSRLSGLSLLGVLR
jgi:flagellar hook-associated protein 3 FlgL